GERVHGRPRVGAACFASRGAKHRVGLVGRRLAPRGRTRLASWSPDLLGGGGDQPRGGRGASSLAARAWGVGGGRRPALGGRRLQGLRRRGAGDVARSRAEADAQSAGRYLGAGAGPPLRREATASARGSRAGRSRTG